MYLGDNNQAEKKRLCWAILIVFSILAICGVSVFKSSIGPLSAYAGPSSGDLDKDGDVDIDDLQLFSQKWLDLNWDEVDWCEFVKSGTQAQKHLGELEEFIVEYFNCDQTEPPEPPSDPFEIVSSNDYPVRLAVGPDDNLYVTDFKAGSVFIYDANLVMTGQLKGLAKPLGVAVDESGNIFVGDSGSKTVEVYNAQGEKTATIGGGLIKMPNDLVFDNDGKLYVADSKNDTVWVFGPNGAIERSIGTSGDGNGQLKFPLAVEIAYYSDEFGLEVGELYVANQGSSLIQVFDLEGNFLRSFGGIVIEHGWWNIWYEWEGFFVSIQSLAFDDLGQLHALDCYMDKVQILDPVTGDYLNDYGEKGTASRQLNLPMDIVIDNFGQTIVAEARNKRVEVIYPMPPLP